MVRIDVPFLIVGAGPVGMIEAALLAKLGRDCLVVERRAGPQTAPAAHVVNARTFEICRQAGLDMQAIDAVCKDPADAGHVRFVTRSSGEEIGHLPFERQGDECLRYTPTPLRNLSQHRFEPLLAEALGKLSGVDLRYGWQWERSEQDEDGITSVVRDLEHGRDRRGPQPLGGRCRRRGQPRPPLPRDRDAGPAAHPELPDDPLRSGPAGDRARAARRACTS